MWEDLAAEIAEEFEGLNRAVDYREISASAGRYYVGNLITWQTKMRSEWQAEDKALPPDVLEALRAQRRVAFRKWHAENSSGLTRSQLRKRQRAEREEAGKCRDCNNTVQHDNVRCDSCKVKHSEYNRQYKAKKKQEAEHMREKMPTDRVGVTQKFTIIARKFGDDGAPLDGVQELKGYITASVYPKTRDNGESHPMAGKLGEIFIKFGKPGEETALLDEWAQSVSRELQRGADPVALFNKHRFTKFEPSGAVQGIKDITRCSSPTDLVANWVGRRFLGITDEKQEEATK